MFVYIQSLLIMMLEILCCKIFFEAQRKLQSQEALQGGSHHGKIIV